MKKAIVEREIRQHLQKKYGKNISRFSLNSIEREAEDFVFRNSEINPSHIDIKTLSNSIKQNGISEISIPLKNFLRMCHLEYNRDDLIEFARPYSDESKFCNDRYRSFLFKRNQIGSMFDLVRTHRPANIKKWEEILYNNNGEKVIKQQDALTEKIVYDGEMIAKTHKRGSLKKAKKISEEYIKHFLVYKTFFGLSFQFGVIKYLSKKLKIKLDKILESQADHEDSIGIDARLEGIKINVKPGSFSYSTGKINWDSNKGIIIVTYDYDIESDKIFINYNQLAIARKVRKLRASI